MVGSETGVTVLDENLEVIETFTTPARPTLGLAHNGRHVIAVQGAENRADVIDAGSWSKGHGDHFHSFVTEPSIADEALSGGKPVHVVPNAAAGLTSVFFDDDGQAVVLDDHVLESGHFDEAKTIKSSGPQHGLIAPLPNHQWLVTQPSAESRMPDLIGLQDDSGKVLDSYTCKEMHGDVIVNKTAAFGCVDSVLIVRDGQATTIAAPDASGERVGALVANADASTLLGDWGPTSLLFINGDQAKVVEVGTTYGNRTVTADGRFAILGTDGVLRLYDAEGSELQTFAVTGAWELPKGHGGVSPAIFGGEQAAAQMIWVSDPAANKVHAVDLFSNTVKSVDVAGAPSSLVVANAG